VAVKSKKCQITARDAFYSAAKLQLASRHIGVVREGVDKKTSCTNACRNVGFSCEMRCLGKCMQLAQNDLILWSLQTFLWLFLTWIFTTHTRVIGLFLVIGLGLRGWPWPKSQGQNLSGGLDCTIDLQNAPLTSVELIFQDLYSFNATCLVRAGPQMKLCT